MIDHLLISTTAGYILFYKDYSSSSSTSFIPSPTSSSINPSPSPTSSIPQYIKTQINQIIHTQIIPGTTSTKSSTKSSTFSFSIIDQGKCFKWVVDSKILVLGIHSIAFSFGSLEKALERIKNDFIKKYYFDDYHSKTSSIKVLGGWDEWDFLAINHTEISMNIQSIITAFASASASLSGNSSKTPRSFHQTQKFTNSLQASKIIHHNGIGNDSITKHVDQLLLNRKDTEPSKHPRTFKPKRYTILSHILSFLNIVKRKLLIM